MPGAGVKPVRSLPLKTGIHPASEPPLLPPEPAVPAAPPPLLPRLPLPPVRALPAVPAPPPVLVPPMPLMPAAPLAAGEVPAIGMLEVPATIPVPPVPPTTWPVPPLPPSGFDGDVPEQANAPAAKTSAAVTTRAAECLPNSVFKVTPPLVGQTPRRSHWRHRRR